MAGEPLVEELALDIQPALDALGPLDTALQTIAADFGTALADAVGGVSISIPSDQIIDPGAITAQIDTAISDVATAPIPVDADVSAVDTAIADALDAPRPPIPVDGDITELTGAIDAAVGTSATIPVDADTTQAQAAIDSLATAPVDVSVTADTTEAQDAIDALGSSATDAIGTGGGGGGGGQGLAGLEGAVLGVKAATGIAQGDVGGLTSAVGGLSSGLGATVGAGIAFTAVLGKTISLAADAQAQQARFNSTFRESADAVRSIDVGGLVTDLSTLGKQSGTTNADLEASATRIGLLGAASGAARPEVAKTASDLLGLAGALAVSNPRFGDAATVADTVSRALSTGRTRSLIPYGISLTQTQIAQEALNQTQKTSVSDLTGYEKLVAGLTLTLAQQGDTLGTKYASGIQNAQIQLRALKIDLEETLVAVGQPLLAPAVASLQAFLPVAKEVGIVLGEVGQIGLPVLAAIAPAAQAIVVPLGILASGLAEIATTVNTLPTPVLVGAAALTALAFAGTAAADAVEAAATASIAFAATPLGAVALGLGLVVGLLGLTSDKSKAATTDTSSLSGAFAVASSTGDTFAGTLTNLNSSIDDYLKKQLQVGDAGQRAVDASNAAGVSITSLSHGLTLSGPEFDVWEAHVTSAADAAGASGKANDRLFDTLEQGRQKLEDSASAALAAAEANGILTDSEVKRLLAQNTQKFTNDGNTQSVVDYIAVLTQLAPKIDKATAAQADAAHQNAVTSDGFTQLAQGIAAGSIGSATAATEAQKLGIATADVTSIIKTQTDALGQQADAQILSTAAAQKLRNELATGTITAAQAQIAFLQLGVTLPGTTKAITDVTGAVTTFVNSGVSNLPTVGSVIDTFASKVKSDMASVASDVKSGSAKIQGDLKTLADDQDPQRFTDNLNAQTANIVNFTNNLKTLIAQGFGTLAGTLAEKGPEAAGAIAASLASDRSKAAAAQGAEQLNAAVVNNFGTLLRSKFPELQAVGEQTGTVIIGGIRVALDASTAGLGTSAEHAGLVATERFKPDFTRSTSAAVAAATDALATDPKISQAAGDKGLDALRAFESTFGPVSADQAVKITLAAARDALAADPLIPAAATAAGERATERFKPDFTRSTSAALAAATTALAGDARISQAAGEKGLAALRAFEDNFGTVTAGQAVTIAVTGAHDALDRDPRLAVKAGEKGKQASDALGQKADVKGAVTKSFADAAAIIPQLTDLTTAAGTAGHAVGVGFDSGMAEGINDPSQIAAVKIAAAGVAAAAEQAAKAALKSKSPSLVARAIGQDFTTGLALGIGDAAPLAAQSAADTADKVVARLQAELTAGLAAAAAQTAAKTALASLVSSAATQIPGASGAISTFGSNLAQAVSGQTAALDTYHKSLATFAADNAKLPGLLSQEQTATNALRSAQQALFTAAAQGAPAATIAALNAIVAQSQNNLNTIAGQVSAARTGLTNDRTAIGTATVGLAAAQKALAAASDPAAFIRNLNAQTQAGARFNADLAKLTKAGLGDLAEQLAAAGPATAGKLADALASHPALAKSAEAAVEHAKTFATNYQASLTRLFADPAVAKTAALAGQTAGAGLGAGLVAGTGPAAAQALVALGRAVAAQPLTTGVHVDITPAVRAVTEQPPIPLRFVPEVGDLHAQIAAAIATVGPIAVDLIPALAALPPLAPIDVTLLAAPVDMQVIPHLAPLPPLPPIDVTVIPHLGRIPGGVPVAGPIGAGTPAAGPGGAAAGPTTLTLDLTIVLPDGKTVTAKADVPVVASRSNLTQLVRAEVHAS